MTVVAPPFATDVSLRRFVGYRMKRAFNAIRADVATTLEPFGLRMVTFSALSVIVENPGLRQSQLADVLSIERPNIVGLLDELARLDLIQRDRSPQDRRALSLRATRRGQDLCTRASAAVAAHDRRMAAGLSASRRADLMAMLDLIEQAGEGPDDRDKTP